MNNNQTIEDLEEENKKLKARSVVLKELTHNRK